MLKNLPIKMPLVIIFLLFAKISGAVVVAGGQITWEQVGEDSLLVNLDVLVDCNSTGIGATYIHFISAYQYLNFRVEGFTEEMANPICNNCNLCNASTGTCNSFYGFKRQRYSLLIPLDTLKGTLNCVHKVYWTLCCRSRIYTTGMQTTNTYFESKINGCKPGDISSPRLKKLDVNVLNLGTRYELDLSVLDARDYDSITYRFDTITTGSKQVNFTWLQDMSYSEPLTYLGFPKKNLKYPRGFHFDTTRAILKFVPAKEEGSILKLEISYYKNGILYGTIEREEAVVVVDDKNDKPPTISSYNCNSSLGNSEDIYACSGDTLNFNFCINDPDSDSLSFEWESLAKDLGAEIQVLDIQKGRVDLNLKWFLDSNYVRKEPYKVIVKAFDERCPYRNVTTKTFYIHVSKARKVSIEYENLACGNVRAIAKVKGVKFNRAIWSNPDFTKLPANSSLKSADSNIFSFDKPGKRSFDFRCFNEDGCVAQISDTVRLKSDFLRVVPNFSDTVICAYDSVDLSVKILAPVKPVRTIWSVGDTSIHTFSKVKVVAPQPHFYNYYSAYVTTDSCSENVGFFVNAHGLDITFLEDDYSICEGDTATLDPFAYHIGNQIDSLANFEWKIPIYSGIYKYDSTLSVTDSGKYLIKMEDEFGCIYHDTGHVQFQNAIIDILGDTTGCLSSTTELYAETDKNGVIKWLNSKDSTLSTDDTVKVELNLKNEFLRLEFTIGQGCITKDSIKLTALKPIEATIMYDSILCENDTLRLSSSIDETEWKIADSTFKGKLVEAEIENWLRADTEYSISVLATDSNNCKSEQSLLMSIEEKPHLEIVAADTVFLGDSIRLSYVANGANKNLIQITKLGLSFSSTDTSFLANELGEYWVYGNSKSSTGCVGFDSARFEVVKKSSIDFKSNQPFVFIYPNPSTSNFTIEKNLPEPVHYTLYKSNGKMVAQGIITNTQKTISNLSSGVYYLNCSNSNQNTTAKIVVTGN
jgi:hypothetical protein